MRVSSITVRLTSNSLQLMTVPTIIDHLIQSVRKAAVSEINFPITKSLTVTQDSDTPALAAIQNNLQHDLRVKIACAICLLLRSQCQKHSLLLTAPHGRHRARWKLKALGSFVDKSVVPNYGIGGAYVHLGLLSFSAVIVREIFILCTHGRYRTRWTRWTRWIFVVRGQICKLQQMLVLHWWDICTSRHRQQDTHAQIKI